MSKRENGLGSVYKRADLKSRPWCAVAPTAYSLGDDGELTAKRMVIGYFKSAREAKEAVDEYLRHPTSKYNITLAELYNEWSDIAYRNISKQTQDNWTASWKKLSQLHDARFRDIRTGQMQSIVDYYAGDHIEIKTRRVDGKLVHIELQCAGQSTSSLQKLKALLTQLYDYAVQNDIVDKNYARFITLPKVKKAKKDAFTEIELEKIGHAVGVIPWADCIYLMCYTGWRISEFLALTPFSYDPDNHTLTGGMKTDAGKDRIVPVHPKVLPILESWLEKGGETIICNDNGEPYTANTWRKRCYYPALDAIGVRRLSPHATRHTMATMLAASGARPEQMQAILGHEDYTIESSTYIHPSEKTLDEAIQKMG